MVTGLTKALTERRPFASLKRRALRVMAPSSFLNEVVGALRDLRLARSNGADSSIHLSAFIHVQAARSSTEAEFRKAQALDWYFRQKTRMM